MPAKRYHHERRLPVLDIDTAQALARVLPWLEDVEQNRAAKAVPQWADVPPAVQRDAATAIRAIKRIFLADAETRENPYYYSKAATE